MRIESKVGVVAVGADSREKAASTQARADQKSAPSSVVQLSSAGASASQNTGDEDVSPLNRTRLDEIREAIKANKYPIDLDRLASKIFDDDLLRGHS